ncbi:MAG TPA: anhydro-N-acetylmuramic acid kinase [Chitinophagaceae bacterium]|nr:anhydro-N-acetylmuramic acid kinase [Chitinophagaceae bacterium]
MNPNIEKLYKIGSKQERLIIGLMSGTSFDGLDIALCKIHGKGSETKVDLLKFETREYPAEFKEELKSVFSRRDADLEKVCVLNAWVALKQAEHINVCLKKWNYKKEEIDLIASHGQTIYHAPKFLHPDDKFPNATLQIGDGDHIAVATGIITISDFRQKHIAAGGEGAPLAVYGDYLIFSKKEENRIMLNIGGIANFTFLPGNLDATKVFSTDVGPGNTMMDALMQKNFPEKYFDEGATIAKAGKINNELLNELKNHSFFSGSFPKTIGPELFNLPYLQNAQKKSATESLSVADQMATLNKFSADMIAEAILRSIGDLKGFSVYVSGGGMHNPLLMENIKSRLAGVEFFSTSLLQIHPDAKEAVLFALLANECIAGGPLKMGTGRNKIPYVTMGKVSFPD